MSEIAHLPAPAVIVRDRMRQLCRWCGTVIEDVDLGLVLVLEGQEGDLPEWPTEHWLHRDGGVSWAGASSDPKSEPPDTACFWLPLTNTDPKDTS